MLCLFQLFCWFSISTVVYFTVRRTCAGRDLGYPKAIVSDRTKWKILCGFRGLVVRCLGCGDAELWVLMFFYPTTSTPSCIFLIRWLVQEWRGLRLLPVLLLLLLMILSSFGKTHKPMHKHAAASLQKPTIHTSRGKDSLRWHTQACVNINMYASAQDSYNTKMHFLSLTGPCTL